MAQRYGHKAWSLAKVVQASYHDTIHVNSSSTLVLNNERKLDPASVDHLFARVLEIDSDPVADARLNLPHAPIGGLGVPHEHPRLKKFIHSAPAFRTLP